MFLAMSYDVVLLLALWASAKKVLAPIVGKAAGGDSGPLARSVDEGDTGSCSR